MRRYGSSTKRGNMRSGLLSLLTLVVVLSISTAAVLTVSTANAMFALAKRQAAMTAQAYAAEQSGQTMLAKLDAELAKAGGSGRNAAHRIQDRANSLLAESCAEGVSATYSIDGTVLTCVFVTEDGRALTTAVDFGNGDSYTVVSWKLTAIPQEESTGDVLWTGSAAKE
jgi:hypothetical protein